MLLRYRRYKLIASTYSHITRSSVDKRTLIENYDLLSLAIDGMWRLLKAFDGKFMVKLLIRNIRDC